MIDKLSQDEKDKLLDLASKLVQGEVTSVTAYGSKIAGYARPDSDYDIIVTAPKYPGRVRYRYLDVPFRASALIAQDDLFLGDARKASLGEFVSGRLLNVNQPLKGADFVNEAGVDSKRRVITEGLLELSNQYGEFAQDLTIPLDFFLFDKLHKRAMIYPPALYSYIRTYTCDSAPANRASSLEGFRKAAESLESQGFLRTTEGGRSVRISSEELKSKTFARLLALLNLTKRGVRQYAVHGYAGRVGLKVVTDEALSKVKRMQQKVEPPRELSHPKSLLELEEGFVVEKTSEAIDRLAKESGYQTYTYDDRGLGEMYSTAKVVTIKGVEGTPYVFKHFADIRSMKWAFLNIWSLSMKFSMSPQARMHREYHAATKLRKSGVMTPRTVGAAIDDRVLIREFVKGRSLSKVVEGLLAGRSTDATDVMKYGATIARVHKTGVALGDSKAENAILTDGDEIYLTDLEQAVDGGDLPWDIAEFLYYSGKLSLKEDGMRIVADAFLDGYLGVNGTENIAKAKAQKYAAPFRAVVTFQVIKVVRESLEAHSHEVK